MNREKEFIVLQESFFKQPTLELAQGLLGKILVHETKDGTCSGIIVETEAYLGFQDRAAHSYGNRRTKRTEIMYQEPGRVYTYQMHTHCLLNIVSGDPGNPEAVLIRAVEPYSGLNEMVVRRPVKKLNQLTSGPGKLTKAMEITMNFYGHPVTEPPLYIAEGKRIEEIQSGPRVGIPNTGEARDYPYRFWVHGSPFVSK